VSADAGGDRGAGADAGADAGGDAGGDAGADAGGDAGAGVARARRERLRRDLLERAVRRGEFVLKSGRRSTWFVDSKQSVCRLPGMLLVAESVLELVPPAATAIGGLTMGADPVAFVTAGVAAARGRALKVFSVRKEEKDHGAGGRVAGALDPGDRVVVTEDTVTRGTSMLQAVEVVRGAGADVVLAVAVVDRGGTAGALLGERGVPFRALFGAPDLGFPFDER